MACAALTAAAQPTFTDQTASSELTAVHEVSSWLTLGGLNVASMLGGGAVADFNNDGYPDIFFLSGGVERDKLYLNDGDGTFTDRTVEWGVDALHMGIGTAVGDYDGDGWLDLYVTSVGPAVAPPVPGSHRLYHNDGGTGFTDMATFAGVATTGPVTADGFGAAFGDYDLDGDLDLMVTGWVLESGCNRLFRNEGDGTFCDVTTEAGLDTLLACRGFGPRFVDMNGDRYPELLIAADFGTSHYFANNGDGTMTNLTGSSGTGLDDNGMGHAVGDFDGNGLLDWYVTSIYTPESNVPVVPGTGNMLYMNQGGDLFIESSIPLGVNDGGWGWGTVAADLDHDRRLDLVETNGWSQPNGTKGPEWLNEQSYLYHNQGNGFTEVALDAGLTHFDQGRGLASLDYDVDGDLDLVVFSYGGPIALYRNEIAGPDTRWLRIRLDTAMHAGLAPDGFGAVVHARTQGETQLRPVDGGTSYLTHSELITHFGLGDAAAVDELTVAWPDGSMTRLCDVAADQTVVVAPGDDQPDLDGDEVVGVTDFLLLLVQWGPCVDPGTCMADLDCDDEVGVIDFLVLLAAWG